MFFMVTIREMFSGDEGSDSSLKMYSEEPPSWSRNRSTVLSMTVASHATPRSGQAISGVVHASSIVEVGAVSAYVRCSIAALISHHTDMEKRWGFIGRDADFSSASVGTPKSMDASEEVESTIPEGVSAKFSWVEPKVLHVSSHFAGKDPTWLCSRYSLSRTLVLRWIKRSTTLGRTRKCVALRSTSRRASIFMSTSWRI